MRLYVNIKTKDKSLRVPAWSRCVSKTAFYFNSQIKFKLHLKIVTLTLPLLAQWGELRLFYVLLVCTRCCT